MVHKFRLRDCHDMPPLIIDMLTLFFLNMELSENILLNSGIYNILSIPVNLMVQEISSGM